MTSAAIVFVLMVRAGHSGFIPTLEFVSDVECRAAGTQLYSDAQWSSDFFSGPGTRLDCIKITKTPIK